MMAPAGGMDWQAKRLEGKVFTVRFIDSAGQIHHKETGSALCKNSDYSSAVIEATIVNVSSFKPSDVAVSWSEPVDLVL